MSSAKFLGSPASGPDGTVYVVDQDRNIFAIDPASRQQRWQFFAADGDGTTRFSVVGAFLHTPAFASDQTVLIAAAEETVYAFDPANGTELCQHTRLGNIKASASVDAEGNVVLGSEGNDSYVITVGATDGHRTPGFWGDDIMPGWSAHSLFFF